VKFYDFLLDPQLGNLADPSYRAWHISARLIDGDGNMLTGDDLLLASRMTQRSAFPGAPATEFYAGVGRRAGKTLFTSRLACWKLAQDYSDRLARGERAVVACIATDRAQAALLFNYARACVTDSPLLAAQLESETSDSLTFAHGTTLEVHTASLRSVRGRSYAAVIIDEAAFLRDAESANPDLEIIRAVRPGLVTLGGMLVVISSPYMRAGVLFNAHRRHFGNNASPALYLAGESLIFNPTLDVDAVRAAIEDDPEAGAAEWRGEFRTDLSAAFSPEWIERAVDPGVFERPRVLRLAAGEPVAYHLFTDPAGGSGRDWWCTYAAHAEGEALVADAVLEIAPPFSTSEAAARVAAFVKSYGASSVRGDRYAGRWPADALAAHGVAYAESEQDRSTIYRESIPLFSSGRVRLLDHARTATQFKMLERRVSPGGKDVIDHGRGGHDDHCNACAGALLMASRACAGEQEIYVVESEIFADYDGDDAAMSLAHIRYGKAW
jgi:hypothetical protein